jgi:hypothetical protein
MTIVTAGASEGTATDASAVVYVAASTVTQTR